MTIIRLPEHKSLDSTVEGKILTHLQLLKRKSLIQVQKEPRESRTLDVLPVRNLDLSEYRKMVVVVNAVPPFLTLIRNGNEMVRKAFVCLFRVYRRHLQSVE